MEQRGENTILITLVAPALSIRLGLRALLDEIPGVTVLRDASTIDEIDLSRSSGDILLLAGRSGTHPAVERKLRGADPGLAVIFLFEETPPPGLFARLSPRAWGAISLDCTLQELSAAIRGCAAGLVTADPAFLVNQLSNSPFTNITSEENGSTGEKLTPREVEVLQQLTLGLANKQIAIVLGMSENTVKFHISSIYTKLGASNRAEAVRLGVQRGFISL
jgi:DNA-binding NarL/FixJ family response regulator